MWPRGRTASAPGSARGPTGFPQAIGIAEDEATGAAAVLMGDRLGRPLTIRQGVGSELHVQNPGDGWIEVGGRVELVEHRAYDLE